MVPVVLTESMTQARKLVSSSSNAGLNTIFEDYVWLDCNTIIASKIPEGRGPMPATPSTPMGPKISDNSSGAVSQARTYPDLLKVRAQLQHRSPTHVHVVCRFLWSDLGSL